MDGQILLKVNFTNRITSSYLISNDVYTFEADTPFEFGIPLTDDVEIEVSEPVADKGPETILKGSENFVISGTVIAYYFDTYMYCLFFETNSFGKYQLVTDATQIEEFENAIANIE